jgi:hypothetical protein
MKKMKNFGFLNWIPCRLVIGLLFICFLICFSQNEAAAQERSRIQMNFVKRSSGDKMITLTLYAGRGRDMVFLSDQIITLTASNGETSVELAQLTTNKDGVAELMIEKGFQFPLDEEGFTSIEASFDGNDDYRGSSAEIEIKDLIFDLEFLEEDSIKTVKIRAYETDSTGNEIPVDGLFMYVGIQRLYSILPIGEIMDSDDGEYSIEFPEDIPGDSTGSYTVVARIEFNDFYGTVEKKGIVQWGTPVSYHLDPPERKVWTDEAPLWMITSVFVVLVGAWYHFFLSIYKLNKIKKVAKD